MFLLAWTVLQISETTQSRLIAINFVIDMLNTSWLVVVISWQEHLRMCKESCNPSLGEALTALSKV